MVNKQLVTHLLLLKMWKFLSSLHTLEIFETLHLHDAFCYKCVLFKPTACDNPDNIVKVICVISECPLNQ